MTSPAVTPARRDAIARYYAHHRERLERMVAPRIAGATPYLVEDACQIAWTRLLRRPDITLDDRGLAWLTITAIREGWSLAHTRPEISAGSFLPGRSDEPGVATEPAGDASDPAEIALEHALHRQRLEVFAQLKPRERRDLYLHALGYRYTEIANATGSTYTAINRRLTEGRARLRRLARANDHD